MEILSKKKLVLLEFDRKLDAMNLSIEVLRRNITSEEEELFYRFAKAFYLFADKIRDANLSNTPISVYETAEMVFRKFDGYLERLRTDDGLPEDRQLILVYISNFADNFLELIPKIKVTEWEALEKEFDQFRRNVQTSKSLISELEQIEVEAANHLADLENVRVDGQKLSQILASKMLNNDYQIRANKEKQAARWWTLLTLVSAFSTFAVLIYIFVNHIDDPINGTINYAALSSKIIMTATLGLISKWSSKRAGRHLAEESKYHRLAVNVEAIGSFIAPLENPAKERVLVEVAIKMFAEGSANEMQTEFESPITDALKKLAANVKS